MTEKIAGKKVKQGNRTNNLRCSASAKSKKIVMAKMKQIYLLWRVKVKIKLEIKHMYPRVKTTIYLTKSRTLVSGTSSKVR